MHKTENSDNSKTRFKHFDKLTMPNTHFEIASVMKKPILF